MSSVKEACNICTGKLDANQGDPEGQYPFFTCAPEPLKIDKYAFNCDAILLAGNNAQGNFHIQRYSGKFNAYQRTYVLTAKDGFDIDYVKYSLEIALSHFKRLAQGSQTKFLTIDMIENFSIGDKKLEEQKTIVRVLKSLDDKILLNKKVNDNLHQQLRQMYDYWFTQFDFPDKNGRPYRSSGGKMVYSTLLNKQLPADWQVSNLYFIADYINGIACQKYRPVIDEATLPVIKIKEMHDGITSDTELVSANIPHKNIVSSGDILFSWSASLEVKLWFGGTGGINQHIFKVVPKLPYTTEYVYLQLSEYLTHFIKIADSRKTTMGHITAEHLEDSCIAVPPASVIQKFTNLTKPYYNALKHYHEETLQLRNFRNWLLPMLMNGQATITD